MKKICCLAVIISLFAANSIAQTEESEEEVSIRERIGLRASYVGTTSGLEQTFGSGLGLALHFVQGITGPLFVDFTFGAFYLGGSDNSDLTLQTFGRDFDNESMRVLTLLLAPTIEVPFGPKTNLYISGGVGLYTVSLLLDEAFLEFDLSSTHFGVNGGAGFVYRLSKNWFFDIGVGVHKFWTSTKGDDIFYLYSQGDQDPLFFQVTGGIMLRLF